MTRLLVCAVDAVPCPPDSQQWVTAQEAFPVADLGFTPEAVTQVVGWGVGVVVLLWSIGYGVGVAVKVIRAF